MDAITGASVVTKTYVTACLAALALFEFWTAMYVFGRKNASHKKLVLRLHRIGGYVFLVCWIWPILVGLDLLGRLSVEGTSPLANVSTNWRMSARVFYHAFLGTLVLVLGLLKISFIRLYTTYRQQARLVGILITVAAVMTWIIAGLYWLKMMSGTIVER